MPKPTAADRQRFTELAPDDPRVEVKPMFGNLGAFVNGNMFMGLFGSAIGLKLPVEALSELVAHGGGPFGPPGRPMGGYAALPAGWGIAEAHTWVQRSLEHVSSLPPKQPRKPKKPTTAKR